VRVCSSVLVGPHCAIDLLHSLCTSWEESDLEQWHAHESEVGALRAELTALHAVPDAWHWLEQRDEALAAEIGKRENVEKQLLKREEDVQSLLLELRALQGCSAELQRLREADARRCEDAECRAMLLEQRCLAQEELRRENAALRQQLHASEAWRAAAASPCAEVVARRVAELECGPLRLCGPEGRPALRRRLLAKWHPDKQPSSEHTALATRVVQELQSQPEWAV